jgi:hypothetical protein
VRDETIGNVCSFRTTNAGGANPTFTDDALTAVGLTAHAACTTADNCCAVAVDRDDLFTSHSARADASLIDDKSASVVTANGSFRFTSAPSVTMTGGFYALGFFVYPAGTLPKNWKMLAEVAAWNWAEGNYIFPEGL